MVDFCKFGIRTYSFFYWNLFLKNRVLKVISVHEIPPLRHPPVSGTCESVIAAQAI